jgi:hypothetical protein
MDWFKIFDGMSDLDRHSGPNRPSVLTGLLSNPWPNGGGDTENESVGSFILFRIAGKVVIAFAALWLFGYVSTLFPYFGRYHYSFANGVRDEHFIGGDQMLLFKGQTAFIEYETKGAEGYEGQIYIDIVPWAGPRPSPHKMALNGKQTGVLEVTIPKTGVYVFRSSIGPMAYRENIEYTVNWGAR